MPNVNYYLKDIKAKTETPIYLFFSFDNQRLKYAIGHSVSPKHWNKDAQKVREKLDAGNYKEINSLLKKLASVCEEEYTKAKTNGIRVTPDFMRDRLNTFLHKNEAKEKGVFEYLNEFMEVQKVTKKKRTIQKFRTLEQHLLNFQRDKKYKITFDSLDMVFYEKFMAYYLIDLRILNNTTGKYISALKSFLRWATERGYNNNPAFIKFKVISTAADIIYLTEQELYTIYQLDLSNNKRLEQVRDAFCLSCFTGLRHSDISNIRKANIKGDQIIMTSYKTREKLEIPLNDFSSEILEKYDYEVPAISNQKFNDYIKEVGKLAEINEPIILTKYRGAEEVKFEKPKWEFLSSHCGRRTFVTLSLEKRMRAETVMAITGHRHYKTFKKYIKITSKVKTVEMQSVWSKNVLKAV